VTPEPAVPVAREVVEAFGLGAVQEVEVQVVHQLLDGGQTTFVLGGRERHLVGDVVAPPARHSVRTDA